MKKRKLIFLVVSLILVITGVVGCGSSHSSSTPASEPSIAPSTNPTDQAATATPEAEQSNNTLAKVMKDKMLPAGTEPDFRPFIYVNNGETTGFSHDLLDYVAKDMGIQFKEVLLPWNGILPGLDTKKFDMVNDAVVITPERVNKYLFTSPIADASVALMVRKDDTKIQSPEDLVGKVVGSEKGSAMLDTTKQYNDSTLKAKGGLKEITEYVGYPEAYQDLKNKRIDAVANSLPNLETIVKQFPNDYRIIGTIGPKSYFGWAFRKDDQALRDAVQKSIEKAAQDGTLAILQKKWFGEAYDLPKNVPN